MRCTAACEGVPAWSRRTRREIRTAPPHVFRRGPPAVIRMDTNAAWENTPQGILRHTRCRSAVCRQATRMLSPRLPVPAPSRSLHEAEGHADHGADVGQSRRRCGPVPAQMWGQSRRRCGAMIARADVGQSRQRWPKRHGYCLTVKFSRYERPSMMPTCSIRAGKLRSS